MVVVVVVFIRPFSASFITFFNPSYLDLYVQYMFLLSLNARFFGF